MKHSLALMTVLLALASAGAGAETVWKWTGKDGKPVFGKQPPAGVKAEQVDIREANVGNLGPARGAGNAAAAAAGGGKVSGGKGNPLAAAALESTEIGGKVVESGSVRLQARAEGRDTSAVDRARCPPELPVCRKQGDGNSSGRPQPPPALLQQQQQQLQQQQKAGDR